MKVIMSLPLAARIGFWALTSGFALGIAVGYRAGASTIGTNTVVDSPSDVRALSRIVDPEGTDIRCISMRFSLSSSVC